MNGSQMETMLRDTLRSHAAGAPAGPDRATELGRARTIRRHRRQGLAALTTAAVVAIVVPVSMSLNQGEGPAPGPAGHTPNPTAKPSPKRTATPAPRYDSLASIPRGKDTALAYVGPDGMVHESGADTPLPGGTKSLTTFGEYRGDWVVTRDPKTDVYDPSGKVIQSGPAGEIKYSADRTEIAYRIGGTVYLSSRNTMGNAGAQPLTAPRNSSLLGFLPEGPAVTGGGKSLTVLGPSPKTVPLPLMPSAVSQSTGLVAGTTGTVAQSNMSGAVTDPKTGALLWHNSWWPHSFSDDGKYVLATPFDNGTPSSYAILDARTGKVIAQTPRMKGVYLDIQAGWDGDTAVFTAFGGTTQEAILTLDLQGNLSRASAVAPLKGALQTYWLGAQP
jgi:hypothetical protein